MIPEFKDKLLDLLQNRFHLEAFRTGQLEILQTVLNNQDGLAVMPTGGGKSLCYQIPSLYRPGIVLVVSPLISLMNDQVRSLRELGIPAGCIHSGMNLSEKQAVFKELRKSNQFILYLSPERVQSPGFAEWLKGQSISLFAIDESHCVSQWGHDFREDYHRLTLLREIHPKVPILALTATATPPVLRDIVKHLGLRKPDRHIHGFYRPNLFYQVEACENEGVKFALLRQALRQFPEGRVLIYCGTRKQCETVVERLSPEFAGMDFYHAGLAPEERNRIQKDYESGATRILAATNAFGMGIDHPDVRLVVHFQMPANIESLYQEMGRAGRDGRDSTCLLLYAKKDKGLQAYFISKSEATASHLRQRWNALDTIVQYSEGADCRHSEILTYFRDAQRIGTCGHCDTCDPQSPRRISQPQPEELAPLIKKEKPGKFLSEEPLTPEEELRAQVLKEWRKNYAKEKDIPAFMVFSNKTLRDLAQKHPKTLSELERIYGMGPQKIEHLGNLILDQLGPF